jgi:hypothetical protein
VSPDRGVAASESEESQADGGKTHLAVDYYEVIRCSIKFLRKRE